jgi:hypothetical protein
VKYIFLGLFILLVYLLVQQWSMKRDQRSQPSKGTVVDETKPDKSKKDGGRNKSPRKVGWGWAVVALLLIVGIGVEWWKYDFHHVKGLSSSFGCQSSLGFTLQFDRSQCLAVTKIGGDGVNNLSFTFVPQKGTNFVNRGEARIVRKDGVCTGLVRATHETSALDWKYQLVPTPCERIDDIAILAAAAEAPDPKWIGNEITVTLSRKE